MEGSGVGSGGIGVHVDVLGSELCHEWLQCSYYTEHGRYGSRNRGVDQQGLYSKLRCEILLLLNMDRLLCRRLWSEQC